MEFRSAATGGGGVGIAEEVLGVPDARGQPVGAARRTAHRSDAGAASEAHRSRGRSFEVITACCVNAVRCQDTGRRHRDRRVMP